MRKQLWVLFFLSLLFLSVMPVTADGEQILITAPQFTEGAEKADAPSMLQDGDGTMSTGGTAVSAQAAAQEELIYSNFNSDPVRNHPDQYTVMNIKEGQERSMALVQRVRTYHWNNGNGSVPGTITVYEDGEKIGTWQAVGRSAYGVQNVYWDALVDFILYPGHSYYIAVSDVDSMSYNEASGNCGMFELYGLKDAPAGYVPSAQGEAAAPITIVNQTGSNAQAPVLAWTSSSAPILNGTALPASVSTGYSFRMGRYEQDNEPNNGQEMIEWRVLAVQNDKALVISKYALDAVSYHTTLSGVTWENSYMRKWLNDSFYNIAFTANEKNQILLSSVSNPDNPSYRTRGGNQTQDRLFLLSIDEANRYFSSNSARKGYPTPYAASYGISVSEEEGSTSWWWLRSPGEEDVMAAYVDVDGRISEEGYSVQNSYGVVRPAFWMRVDRSACLTVKYVGGSCLAQVPTDKKCYKKGDKVTVLFEPVEYMPGLIFNGWDRTGDGVADHGYYYNDFIMPDHNVELTAICYQPQYDYGYDFDHDVPPNDPVQRPYDPGQYPDNPWNGSALYPDGTTPNYNYQVPGGQWYDFDGVG